MGRLVSIAFFVALGILPGVRTAAADGPLAARVDDRTVTVQNITPGGDVVLLGVGIESDGGLLAEMSRALRGRDEDRDGIVIFDAGRPIPFRSIWVAVDIESSRPVIAGPDGYELDILPFPESLTKKEAAGVLGIFDNERVSAQMLVVTRKGGAWRLVATEGSSADADGASNGRLSLAAADALPIGNSGPAPRHLKNGDVIAVIDPGRMEVFVAEVGK